MPDKIVQFQWIESYWIEINWLTSALSAVFMAIIGVGIYWLYFRRTKP